MVGPVERHCGVGVIRSGISGIIEQAHGDDDGRRQLAVCEGDVEVLIGLIGEHFDGGSIEPRKAEGARQLLTSITGVVEIHDIIHVLEREPVVLGEEVKGTEWG